MGLDETDFPMAASVKVWDVGAVYVMLSASGSVFQRFCGVLFSFHFFPQNIWAQCVRM